MNCSICGKPIRLSPTAAQRAAKDMHRTAKDYERMFTTHADCALQKREQETIELMRRTVERQKKARVVL